MSMSRDYRQMYNDDSQGHRGSDKEFIESETEIDELENHVKSDDAKFDVEIRHDNKVVSFQSAKMSDGKNEKLPFFSDDEDNDGKCMISFLFLHVP